MPFVPIAERAVAAAAPAQGENGKLVGAGPSR